MKKIKYLILLCLLLPMTSCERNALPSRNEDAFIISSINDSFDKNAKAIYKMKSQYDDTYKMQCFEAYNMNLYDEKGKLLVSGDDYLSIDVNENQIIYLEMFGQKNVNFTLFVDCINHQIELPYKINSSIDLSSLSAYSNNDEDPLKPAIINYKKRNDEKGLYINCNNPEALSWNELNTCLTRQDVSEKEVFFTFEHNNISSINYYYGYRVTNKDKKDIYVTIKNLGYQVNGDGSWLGENEWIQFYNTKFESDISSLTTSQLANYKSYVGFSNNYNPIINKPITYKIPAGKYIYVLGGTSKDAYNNINVFNSANIKVNGGCGNGAVIFSVTGGKAEGSFLVYDDDDAYKINKSEYVTNDLQYGYRVERNNKNVGSQYVGYDNCHGVVDADLMWTFNDLTPSKELPVSYSNPYYVNDNYREGTPYSKINSFSKIDFDKASYWITHINPNHVSNAVATDMTQYITVDYESKEDIAINYLNYDGRGKTVNIGNWMVDYIETITLINQGSKEREFTYTLGHSGVILAFVRDENGNISSLPSPSYYTILAKSEYGDAISQPFTYTVKIKPNSIVRFSINYNLLANSYGAIRHQTYLK